MRLSYWPPYLSLQSPPGAMFSIALLNIQVQSQSRVKGAREKNCETQIGDAGRSKAVG